MFITGYRVLYIHISPFEFYITCMYIVTCNGRFLNFNFCVFMLKFVFIYAEIFMYFCTVVYNPKLTIITLYNV